MKKMIKEIARNAKMTLEKAEVNYKEANQVVGATEKKDDLLEVGKHFSILKTAKYLENIPAKYGLADAIDIELEVYKNNDDYGSIEKTSFRERFFKSASAHSPYYLHLKEILGKDPRDGFATDELVGKILEIEIVHNKSVDGKKTYANIGSVRVVDAENIKEVI